MLDIEDLNFHVYGPMGVLVPYESGNGTLTKYGDYLAEQLASVVKQVGTVDHLINNHSTYLWSIISIIILIAIMTTGAAYMIRRNSEKFWEKIYAIRKRAEELARQLLSLEVSLPLPIAAPRFSIPPPTNPNWNGKRDLEEKYTGPNVSYLNINEKSGQASTEKLYSTMDRYERKSVKREFQKYYPDLSQFADVERAKLERNLSHETEEVKLLMQQRNLP